MWNLSLDSSWAMRCNNRIATFGESSAQESSTWKIIIEFSEAKRSTWKQEMEWAAPPSSFMLWKATRMMKQFVDSSASESSLFSKCIHSKVPLCKYARHPEKSTNHCSPLFPTAGRCYHEVMSLFSTCARRWTGAPWERRIIAWFNEIIAYSSHSWWIHYRNASSFLRRAVCKFHRAKNATLPTTNDSHFLSLCAPSSVPCFYIKFLLYMLLSDLMLNFCSRSWNTSRSEVCHLSFR